MNSGTNINSALQRGMELLTAHTTSDSAESEEGEDTGTEEAGVETTMEATSLIVFLTDGQPTDGVTNKHTILDNVKTTNAGRFTLFSLGFGESVDFPFLQQMALQV